MLPARSIRLTTGSGSILFKNDNSGNGSSFCYCRFWLSGAACEGRRKMRRCFLACTAILLAMVLSACTSVRSMTDKTVSSQSDIENAAPATETGTDEEEVTEMTLKISIGDTPVQVDWEKNESVEALKKLCVDEPLTIKMSMYGGFEQVGSIGSKLPRNDKQTTTTTAGDIVLYSGDQMVVFYGSNSWAYTRLGHITDKTAEEMSELLSNGDVTITVSYE